MPNPGGTNQFQGFSETIPYGEKARQGMLQRLAPLAGSSPAVGAPRRDQRAATREAATAPETEPPALVPPTATLPPSQVYAAIASIPGASPLVQQVFSEGVADV